MHIYVGYWLVSIPVKILTQKFHGLRVQRKFIKKNHFLKIIEFKIDKQVCFSAFFKNHFDVNFSIFIVTTEC